MYYYLMHGWNIPLCGETTLSLFILPIDNTASLFHILRRGLLMNALSSCTGLYLFLTSLEYIARVELWDTWYPCI